MKVTSKTGEAGTTKTGKSHEADIARGEGIAIGSVDKAHEKHKVATTAKENVSAQAKAHAAHERRENGGADPKGEALLVVADFKRRTARDAAFAHAARHHRRRSGAVAGGAGSGGGAQR